MSGPLLASTQPAHTLSADTTGEPDFQPSYITLGLQTSQAFSGPLWVAVDAVAARPTNGPAADPMPARPGDVPSTYDIVNPFSKDYLNVILLDVKTTFTAPAHWGTTGWIVLGGVTAGVLTVGVFDEDIQRAVQRNRNTTVNNIFNAVEPFGAEYSAGVLGAFYVGGLIFNDGRARSVALDGAAASLIASGLILYPVKYTVGRARPNQHLGAYNFQPFGGHDSFPSGHTTQAFAVATVIAEHYDEIWVKIGSYGLASMVGYARLNNNYHWASDVLAGAALGTFVGHVVVQFNAKHQNVSLQPILEPHLQGAQLTFRF